MRLRSFNLTISRSSLGVIHSRGKGSTQASTPKHSFYTFQNGGYRNCRRSTPRSATDRINLKRFAFGAPRTVAWWHRRKPNQRWELQGQERAWRAAGNGARFWTIRDSRAHVDHRLRQPATPIHWSADGGADLLLRQRAVATSWKPPETAATSGSFADPLTMG